MPLNSSQIKALDHNRNLLVSAGAGSGKTTILIERIIQLLLLIENLEIHQILAITFTKKAANEMKERLIKRLQDLYNQKLDPKHKKKIQKCLKESERIEISTIHSFLNNYLKQNSYYLGLDSDFTIIDSYDYKQSFNSIFENYVNEKLNNNDKQFAEMFRSFGKERLKNFIYFLNENEILCSKEKKQSIESLKDFWIQVDRKYQENLNEKFLLDSRLHSLIKFFSELVERDFKKSNKSVKELQDALAELKEVHNLPFLIHCVLTQKGSIKAFILKSIENENDLSKVELLAEYLLNYKSEILPALNESDFEYLRLYHDLIKYSSEINKLLNEDRFARNMITYNDLEKLSLYFLQNYENLQNEARFRYQFIMIDEFQDTNFTQWEILSHFARKENGHLQEQKLFLVGDPKQSIYSFRDADIRVFRHALTEVIESNTANKKDRLEFNFPLIVGKKPDDNSATIREKAGALVLSENYRTNKQALQLINSVFDKLFNEKRTDYDIDAQELSFGKHSDEEKEAKTKINIYFSKDKSKEYEGIIETIEKLINSGYNYKDFAILLRSRTKAEKLISHFKRSQLPYHSYLSQSFYSRQEVIDMFNLLNFVSYPNDELTLYAVLKSPFFNYKDIFFKDFKGNKLISYLEEKGESEAVKKLKRIRKLSAKLPIDLFFSQLLNEYHYFENYNSPNIEQAIENVNKLISSLKEESKKQNTNIVHLCQFLKRQINNEEKESEAEVLIDESENKIKIMTIHNSKGLQFPIVILPDLESSYMGQASSVYKHIDYGFFSNAFYKEFNSKGFISEFFKLDSAQQRVAEEKRVFYVAMTRVQEQLFLSSSLEEKKIPKNSYLSFLNYGLNNTLNDFKDSSTSLYDLTHYFTEDYDGQNNESQRKNPTINYFVRKKFEIPKIKSKNIYSVTRIESFLQNREKYIQQYEYGYFEQDYSDKLLRKNNEIISPTLYGTILHKLFEDISLVSDFDAYIDFLLKEANVSSYKTVFEKLKKDLHRFLESDKTKFIHSAKQVLNEQEIHLIINDEYFIGKLDLVIQTNDMEWLVIDYKTNKVKPENLNKVAAKYHLQMESYACLLSKIIPQQSNYKVMLYFVEIDEFYEKSYSKEQLYKLEKKWGEIIDEIKAFEESFYKKLV